MNLLAAGFKTSSWVCEESWLDQSRLFAFWLPLFLHYQRYHYFSCPTHPCAEPRIYLRIGL